MKKISFEINFTPQQCQSQDILELLQWHPH